MIFAFAAQMRMHSVQPPLIPALLHFDPVAASWLIATVTSCAIEALCCPLFISSFVRLVSFPFFQFFYHAPSLPARLQVPHGVAVDYGTPQFASLEERGLAVFKDCAFVLVAGGLGERLG